MYYVLIKYASGVRPCPAFARAATEKMQVSPPRLAFPVPTSRR
jgi:hypothetical protein